MDVGRAQAIVVFVAFLWVFVTNNSNGNWKFAEAITINEVSLDIPGIGDETANEIWIHCSRELKECIHFLESLEVDLSRTSIRHENPKLNVDLLAEGIIEAVIPNSPFQEKQFLFECFRKKNFLYDESGGDFGSNTWISKCQELFSRWSTVPRRFLRHRTRPFVSVRLAQSPAPIAASPDFASAPSYNLVPASSPSPNFQPPLPVLHPPSPVLQPPSPEPSPQPAVAINPPQPADDINPPQPAEDINPPPSPPARPQNGAVTPFKKYEAAVIAASSLGGLALVALLLFCCCINRRKDQGSPGETGQNGGKRDEKPLLNFCSSDVSADSSQTSQNLGNFSNTNFRPSSIVSNSVVGSNITGSSAEAQLATLDASGNTHVLLPLPPGRSAAPPPPPPTPPPPPPPRKPPAPAPPPPPKMARPPPNPPKPSNLAKPSSLGGHNRGNSSSIDGSEMSGDSDAPKAKLKPFFWEKVMANPDHSMVWNDIKAGSFQFNEEMMESLFGYAAPDKGKYEHKKGSASSESVPMYIQIIDPKKAQNLAILLRALNVTTEEVCDALKEGNELPIELVETLLKMAPTTDEELKLRLFTGDVALLGPAERFLKVVVDIPFAFKRMESLLFMSSFRDEATSIAESFATLEVACKELKNSRLFLKLLEAVLKTGNRMNVGTYRGGAMAFKLDTLLKLSDVKGTDGKTTLLHFVVQEIIRSEGLRAARRLRESHSMSSVKTEDLFEESSQESEDYHRSLGLQVVSDLSNDLKNVRKAAAIDGDDLTGAVSNLGHSILKTKNFLNTEMMTNLEEDSEFCAILSSFTQQAEVETTKLLEEEKKIMALVKSTGDYFHGNAGKDEGIRLFVVVRDFLIMVDKACKDVRNLAKLPAKPIRRDALAPSPSQESRQESLPDFHQRLFPAIKERRGDDSSSDDDN